MVIVEGLSEDFLYEGQFNFPGKVKRIFITEPTLPTRNRVRGITVRGTRGAFVEGLGTYLP